MIEVNDPDPDLGSDLVRVATTLLPGLDVLSVSKPAPAAMEFNVVAVAESADAAREATLDLEALQHHDDGTSIGLVMLGSPTRGEHEQVSVDPEGVVGAVAPRVIVGGLIGAIVGAAAGAVIAAFVDGVSVPVALLPGAALGATIGAIWWAFARLGGSDAYRQTFVEPRPVEVGVVSFHCHDRETADAAFDKLLARTMRRVMLLDATLSRVDG